MGEDLLVLLPAHFEHFPVAVRVDASDEGWAARRAVLRQQPARFIPDAARVAERLSAVRPNAPLRRLVNSAVSATSICLCVEGVIWLSASLFRLLSFMRS